MITLLIGFLKDTWLLLVEMAPYLLFGFIIAGILRVIIPKEKIYKHLANNDFRSIVKATMLGVPLPLCSCGVIPVAAHLRKEGAGKGPILAFLISTPETGVDSMLATYSLLGPLFAIFRPIAALFNGIFAGSIANVIEKEDVASISDTFSCAICDSMTPHTHNLSEKIKEVFKYAFFNLINDTSKWLIIGVLIGGIIKFFIPSIVIEKYLGNPLLSYTAMIITGIPMYVCATGSIPIAASLIMKGMTPGAGLVFLIAGPATNSATISFVYGKFGKKSVFIYLSTIIITSVIFGLFLDLLWQMSGRNIHLITGGPHFLPHWFKNASALLLITLMTIGALKSYRKGKCEMLGGKGILLKVSDMTCERCVKSLESRLKILEGVIDVKISLKTKEIEVIGTAARETIISAIEEAGFSVDT